jgi:hypothetical protein
MDTAPDAVRRIAPSMAAIFNFNHPAHIVHWHSFTRDHYRAVAREG